MKKYIVALLGVGCWVLGAQAQGSDAVDARAQIKENVCRSASNYYAYPGPTKKLTPAPKRYSARAAPLLSLSITTGMSSRWAK